MSVSKDPSGFYAVPCNLNYDKYFKDGNIKRTIIDEFPLRLNLEETKAKIASLTYIQNELNGIPDLV